MNPPCSSTLLAHEPSLLINLPCHSLNRFDDPADTELLKLAGFLRGLVDAEDVRPIVRNHFKSHELVSNAALGFAPVTTSPPF